MLGGCFSSRDGGLAWRCFGGAGVCGAGAPARIRASCDVAGVSVGAPNRHTTRQRDPFACAFPSAAGDDGNHGIETLYLRLWACGLVGCAGRVACPGRDLHSKGAVAGIELRPFRLVLCAQFQAPAAPQPSARCSPSRLTAAGVALTPGPSIMIWRAACELALARAQAQGSPVRGLPNHGVTTSSAR